MIRLLAALPLLALVACVDDSADPSDSSGTADTSVAGDTAPDTDTNPQDTSDSGTAGDVTLTSGTWVSAGDDVSALFASLDPQITEVVADFREDGTYEVVSTLEGGREFPLEGTYTVGMSTTPHTITLNQSQPSATAVGIWEIRGTTLTYEVVQTNPAVPCSPPSPETGFGSTRCSPPLTANANVQTFVRQ